MKNKAIFSSLLLFCACSPLKSSPHDEKHQLELTLHEVQTNLDDLRHDMHCFRADLEILDGRIRGFEHAIASLKKEDVERHAFRVEQLHSTVQQLEKRIAATEQAGQLSTAQLQQLSLYAQEATAALAQYRDRIHEIEKELISGQRKVDEVVKKTLASKVYRVKPGDSLKRIAQLHNTTVEKLKQLNALDREDLIFVNQDLKIPCEQ